MFRGEIYREKYELYVPKTKTRTSVSRTEYYLLCTWFSGTRPDEKIYREQ